MLFDERLGSRVDLADRADEQGVASIGWMFLQVTIDQRLANSTAVRMDEASGRPVLRFRPRHLLGALWVQLARAVDGNRSFRACQTCGRWFELDPSIARTNRLYHTAACRQKAYRQRVANQRVRRGLPPGLAPRVRARAKKSPKVMAKLT
jgi:hypothetical protein